jgi:polysaccharide biosynthesis/export protein
MAQEFLQNSDLQSQIKAQMSQSNQNSENDDSQEAQALALSDKNIEEPMFYRSSELDAMSIEEHFEIIGTLLEHHKRRDLLDIYYFNLSLMSDNELQLFNTKNSTLELHPSLPKKLIITQLKNNYFYKESPEISQAIVSQYLILFVNDETNEQINTIILYLQQDQFNIETYKNIFVNKELESITKSFNPFYNPNVMEITQKIKKNQLSTKRKSLQRFSETFFDFENEKTYNTLIDETYILSKNDKLKLSVFGNSNKEYYLKVNMEGNIVIPGIGKIKATGHSYTHLKKVIGKQAVQSFPNAKVILSLEKTSPITITITGNAKEPGAHTISPFSHIKDALIQSGGINNIGSVRNIILIRNQKKIVNFDLYQLLIEGNDKHDLALRSGDIIHIPTADTLVSLYGEAKSEAIFELKSHETLNDLILFSGGLKSNALHSEIYLFGNRENRYKTYKSLSLNSNERLKDGDEVIIGQLTKIRKNRLSIFGNVIKPGDYHFHKDEKLSQFFKRTFAKTALDNFFLPETIMDYFLLKRIDSKSLKSKVLSYNLYDFLNQTKKGDDILLMQGDELYFFNRQLANANESIKIEGEVTKNGNYHYYEGMTLLDLLYTAGLTQNAYLDKIKVLYKKTYTDPELHYYHFNVAKSIHLKPNSEIYVASQNEIEEILTLTINGAVNKAGQYRYTENATINDLLAQANGLLSSAYHQKFEISRYKIIDSKRVLEIKNYNLDEAIKDKLKLFPDDKVTIFTIPDWDESVQITLKGEVQFPGIYSIRKGERLASVIERAGGYKEEAFLYGAVFSREDVKKMQQVALEKQRDDLNNILKSMLATSSKENNQALQLLENLKGKLDDINSTGRITIDLPSSVNALKESIYNIVIKNGDTLFIPKKEDSVLVMGEVYNPTSIIYNPNENGDFYIDKAGGSNINANDDNIFIVHANGETEQLYKGLFSSNAKVLKGDLIIVPLDFSLYNSIELTRDLTDILYKLAFSAAALKNIGAY